jgi:type I restriction enzyme R subunit
VSFTNLKKYFAENRKSVKLAAHTLLERLFDANNNILIQEWWKEKATQEKVKREIQIVLGKHLPEPVYDRILFTQKVDVTYQHFFELAQMGRAVVA